MAAKKPKRQPKDPVTHRFQSVLTRELLEGLCATHEEGADYRNVTAARKGVHPKLLTRWLKQGEREESGLLSELYLRFIAIEGDIRAACIKEVRDTTASIENTEFEGGKPINRTVTSRRTSGVQWYMERRFRQFRVEHLLSEDEQDAMSLLQPQAQTLTTEMAIALCQQLAQNPERLPEPIRILFAATDWRAPKKLSHGEETAH